MSFVVRLLDSLAGGPVARAWHRFAPSVTLFRKFLGMRLYFDSRDNAWALVVPASVLESREWPLLELPTHIDGPVWDVGANIGSLTLAAAKAGRMVTAFEMSSRAVELLRRSRDANEFDFEVVARGFSMTEGTYHAPATAYPGNRLTLSDEGSSRTITYVEAAKRYGAPGLIKMDIEGMEEEFLKSPDFKRWICEHGIIFYVEVHSKHLGYTPSWQDVPHVSFAGVHHLYCPDAVRLNRLLEVLGMDAALSPRTPSLMSSAHIPRCACAAPAESTRRRRRAGKSARPVPQSK